MGQSYRGHARRRGAAGYFFSDGNNAIQATSTAPNFHTILAQCSSSKNAAVSAQNTNGGFGVWAKATGATPGAGGAAGYFFSDGNNAIQATSTAPNFDTILAQCSSSQHAAVSAQNSSGGFGVWVKSAGTAIWAQGSTYAAQFEGNVQVNGAHYVTGDVQVAGDVVLINAISGDVAEDFDLEDGGANAEPGSVLVIGANGKLRACDEPYDSRLAGVVSGAGELRPAVVLQRIETDVPRSPIALIGKAYCKVDASFGPIAAGDTPDDLTHVRLRDESCRSIKGSRIGIRQSPEGARRGTRLDSNSR